MQFNTRNTVIEIMIVKDEDSKEHDYQREPTKEEIPLIQFYLDKLSLTWLGDAKKLIIFEIAKGKLQ